MATGADLREPICETKGEEGVQILIDQATDIILEHGEKDTDHVIAQRIEGETFLIPPSITSEVNTMLPEEVSFLKSKSIDEKISSEVEESDQINPDAEIEYEKNANKVHCNPSVELKTEELPVSEETFVEDLHTTSEKIRQEKGRGEEAETISENIDSLQVDLPEDTKAPISNQDISEKTEQITLKIGSTILSSGEIEENSKFELEDGPELKSEENLENGTEKTCLTEVSTREANGDEFKAIESLQIAPLDIEASSSDQVTKTSSVEKEILSENPQEILVEKIESKTRDSFDTEEETLEVKQTVPTITSNNEYEETSAIEKDDSDVKYEAHFVKQSEKATDEEETVEIQNVAAIVPSAESTIVHKEIIEDEDLRKTGLFESEKNIESAFPIKSSQDTDIASSIEEQSVIAHGTVSEQIENITDDGADTKEETPENLATILSNVNTEENPLIQVDESGKKHEELLEKESEKTEVENLVEPLQLAHEDNKASVSCQETKIPSSLEQLSPSENLERLVDDKKEEEIIDGDETTQKTQEGLNVAAVVPDENTEEIPLIQEEKEREIPSTIEFPTCETNDVESIVIHKDNIEDEGLKKAELIESENNIQSDLPIKSFQDTEITSSIEEQSVTSHGTVSENIEDETDDGDDTKEKTPENIATIVLDEDFDQKSLIQVDGSEKEPLENESEIPSLTESLINEESTIIQEEKITDEGLKNVDAFKSEKDAESTLDFLQVTPEAIEASSSCQDTETNSHEEQTISENTREIVSEDEIVDAADTKDKTQEAQSVGAIVSNEEIEEHSLIQTDESQKELLEKECEKTEVSNSIESSEVSPEDIKSSENESEISSLIDEESTIIQEDDIKDEDLKDVGLFEREKDAEITLVKEETEEDKPIDYLQTSTSCQETETTSTLKEQILNENSQIIVDDQTEKKPVDVADSDEIFPEAQDFATIVPNEIKDEKLLEKEIFSLTNTEESNFIQDEKIQDEDLKEKVIFEGEKQKESESLNEEKEVEKTIEYLQVASEDIKPSASSQDEEINPFEEQSQTENTREIVCDQIEDKLVDTEEKTQEAQNLATIPLNLNPEESSLIESQTKYKELSIESLQVAPDEVEASASCQDTEKTSASEKVIRSENPQEPVDEKKEEKIINGIETTEETREALIGGSDENKDPHDEPLERESEIQPPEKSLTSEESTIIYKDKMKDEFGSEKDEESTLLKEETESASCQDTETKSTIEEQILTANTEEIAGDEKEDKRVDPDETKEKTQETENVTTNEDPEDSSLIQADGSVTKQRELLETEGDISFSTEISSVENNKEESEIIQEEKVEDEDLKQVNVIENEKETESNLLKEEREITSSLEELSVTENPQGFIGEQTVDQTIDAVNTHEDTHEARNVAAIVPNEEDSLIQVDEQEKEHDEPLENDSEKVEAADPIESLQVAHEDVKASASCQDTENTKQLSRSEDPREIVDEQKEDQVIDGAEKIPEALNLAPISSDENADRNSLIQVDGSEKVHEEPLETEREIPSLTKSLTTEASKIVQEDNINDEDLKKVDVFECEKDAETTNEESPEAQNFATIDSHEKEEQNSLIEADESEIKHQELVENETFSLDITADADTNNEESEFIQDEKIQDEDVKEVVTLESEKHEEKQVDGTLESLQVAPVENKTSDSCQDTETDSLSEQSLTANTQEIAGDQTEDSITDADDTKNQETQRGLLEEEGVKSCSTEISTVETDDKESKIIHEEKIEAEDLKQVDTIDSEQTVDQIIDAVNTDEITPEAQNFSIIASDLNSLIQVDGSEKEHEETLENEREIPPLTRSLTNDEESTIIPEEQIKDEEPINVDVFESDKDAEITLLKEETEDDKPVDYLQASDSCKDTETTSILEQKVLTENPRSVELNYEADTNEKPQETQLQNLATIASDENVDQNSLIQVDGSEKDEPVKNESESPPLTKSLTIEESTIVQEEKTKDENLKTVDVFENEEAIDFLQDTPEVIEASSSCQDTETNSHEEQTLSENAREIVGEETEDKVVVAADTKENTQEVQDVATKESNEDAEENSLIEADGSVAKQRELLETEGEITEIPNKNDESEIIHEDKIEEEDLKQVDIIDSEKETESKLLEEEPEITTSSGIVVDRTPANADEKTTKGQNFESIDSHDVDGSQTNDDEFSGKEREILSLTKSTKNEKSAIIHEDTNETLKEVDFFESEKPTESTLLKDETTVDKHIESLQVAPEDIKASISCPETESTSPLEGQIVIESSQRTVDDQTKEKIIDSTDTNEKTTEAQKFVTILPNENTKESPLIQESGAQNEQDELLEKESEIVLLNEDEIIQEGKIQDEYAKEVDSVESEKHTESILLKEDEEEEKPSKPFQVTPEDIEVSASCQETETISCLEEQILTKNSQGIVAEQTEDKVVDGPETKEEIVEEQSSTTVVSNENNGEKSLIQEKNLALETNSEELTNLPSEKFECEDQKEVEIFETEKHTESTFVMEETENVESLQVAKESIKASVSCEDSETASLEERSLIVGEQPEDKISYASDTRENCATVLNEKTEENSVIQLDESETTHEDLLESEKELPVENTNEESTYIHEEKIDDEALKEVDDLSKDSKHTEEVNYQNDESSTTEIENYASNSDGNKFGELEEVLPVKEREICDEKVGDQINSVENNEDQDRSSASHEATEDKSEETKDEVLEEIDNTDSKEQILENIEDEGYSKDVEMVTTVDRASQEGDRTDSESVKNPDTKHSGADEDVKVQTTEVANSEQVESSVTSLVSESSEKELEVEQKDLVVGIEWNDIEEEVENKETLKQHESLEDLAEIEDSYVEETQKDVQLCVASNTQVPEVNSLISPEESIIEKTDYKQEDTTESFIEDIKNLKNTEAERDEATDETAEETKELPLANDFVQDCSSVEEKTAPGGNETKTDENRDEEEKESTQKISVESPEEENFTSRVAGEATILADSTDATESTETGVLEAKCERVEEVTQDEITIAPEVLDSKELSFENYTEIEKFTDESTEKNECGADEKSTELGEEETSKDEENLYYGTKKEEDDDIISSNSESKKIIEIENPEKIDDEVETKQDTLEAAAAGIKSDNIVAEKILEPKETLKTDILTDKVKEDEGPDDYEIGSCKKEIIPLSYPEDEAKTEGIFKSLENADETVRVTQSESKDSTDSTSKQVVLDEQDVQEPEENLQANEATELYTKETARELENVFTKPESEDPREEVNSSGLVFQEIEENRTGADEKDEICSSDVVHAKEEEKPKIEVVADKVDTDRRLVEDENKADIEVEKRDSSSPIKDTSEISQNDGTRDIPKTEFSEDKYVSESTESLASSIVSKDFELIEPDSKAKTVIAEIQEEKAGTDSIAVPEETEVKCAKEENGSDISTSDIIEENIKGTSLVAVDQENQDQLTKLQELNEGFVAVSSKGNLLDEDLNEKIEVKVPTAEKQAEIIEHFSVPEALKQEPENVKFESSIGSENISAITSKSSQTECEEQKPSTLEQEEGTRSLLDLLHQVSAKETSQKGDQLTYEKETIIKKEEHIEENSDEGNHEEVKSSDEDESGEHKRSELDSESPVMVNAGEADVKVTPKKSHNILSGVGSKVKHSIAKVKKAITGKSSHSKPPSPKQGEKC